MQKNTDRDNMLEHNKDDEMFGLFSNLTTLPI